MSTPARKLKQAGAIVRQWRALEAQAMRARVESIEACLLSLDDVLAQADTFGEDALAGEVRQLAALLRERRNDLTWAARELEAGDA